MKTKFFAFLTGLTTLTTVVAATAPAQANEEIDALMKAFFEFAPTQDHKEINEEAGLSGIKEVNIGGALKLGQDIENLEAVFLGEVAGYTTNTLSLGDQTLWSDIKAYNELYDGPYKLGTFNSKYNDGVGSLLDIGSTVSLGSFKAGDLLNFGVSNEDFNFSMSSAPTQFKGYTLAGFEDWLVIGIEDSMGKFSDWDYNDTVFAVKVGASVSSVPEPSTIAALMGVSAAFGFSRRQKAKKS
ncbi:PEP-CTERM sorting domain-containing protein [Capilliphycus salinus ALCB114379]|uniref:PEP-CTERM sorting domain-containing protein n=1 Tax=Capilliphycus salinus TaxID=2768948 RepID=UPI0039A72CA3